MKSALIKSIGILLIELPEGSKIEKIKSVGIGHTILQYSYPKGFNTLYESGTYIGQLSELKDEQFARLVDSWESVSKDGAIVYENYKSDVPKCRTARESFLSAVEAEGLRIGVMEEKPVYNGNGDDESISDFDFESISWYTAESKTFNPSLTHLLELETK